MATAVWQKWQTQVFEKKFSSTRDKFSQIVKWFNFQFVLLPDCVHRICIHSAAVLEVTFEFITWIDWAPNIFRVIRWYFFNISKMSDYREIMAMYFIENYIPTSANKIFLQHKQEHLKTIQRLRYRHIQHT